ncbi:MAG: HlyD family efflux transporter periplasmic adaptor subunit [Pseudomonadota bacterium]
MMGGSSEEAQRVAVAIRRTIIVGVTACALLVVGVGGWAAMARLASAVVAPGVVVATGASVVQHPTGGVVAAVHVRDGMAVRTNQPLLSLDDVALAAELDVIDAEITVGMARQARLVAERDGSPALAVPDRLASRPDGAEALAKETRLFELRRSRFQDAARQLSKKGKALNALIGELDRAPGPSSAEERVRLASALAQEAQNRLDRAALVTQREEGAERESAVVASELARLEARRRVVAHQRAALTVRAPASGTVFEMAEITTGSVVRPGETVMRIVAQDEPLDIEVRLPPADVDQVQPGQSVRVVMGTLRGRVAPELAGTVVVVGAEASLDQRTGQPFYSVRIALDPRDAARELPAVELRPGMPVEVFIPTGTQTVVAYLMRPLTDQIRRAWRES